MSQSIPIKFHGVLLIYYNERGVLTISIAIQNAYIIDTTSNKYMYVYIYEI